ncbi:MAG: (Fe-S)-binding protein, partial [Thermodesulfovibrionales bacterium]|nr:(Fe-S)-binding protein [Thermodesulfovibrionales bacterium]
MIEEFLEKCNSCGKCKKVCPFLSRYGNPDEILKTNYNTVFECTNCGACTVVCPFKLTPSEAIHTRKHLILQSGNVSQRVTNALNTSRAFANRGHKFPFKHYCNCEIAFWPGCGLAGVSPEIVKASIKSLSMRLNKPVGLILDCCFDPCYQMGDLETVQNSISQIQKSLEGRGVKELITGCGNCTKVLSKYLQGITVKHIFEVLEREDLSELPMDFVLHHPCPSFRFKDVQDKAKVIMPNTDNIQANKLPSCCGLGGGLHHLNPDLSNSFTKEAIMGSKYLNKEHAVKQSTILTYCMGCKSKFIKQGAKAYHVLEGLKGVKKLEDVPSPTKKYLNR